MNWRTTGLIICSGLWLISCGNDDNGNGNDKDTCAGSAGLNEPGCQLIMPDQAPKSAAGNADYSCLTKVTPPEVPDKDLVVRGMTQQRLSNGNDEEKGDVTVEVWTDQSSLSEATRVAKVTSDPAGNYEVVIPAAAWANASSPGVRVAWRISAPDTLPTVEYDDPLPIAEAKPDADDPSRLAVDEQNRITVTRSTLQLINALLGTTNVYDKNKGIVLGVVRDCQRNEVEHASAGVVDGAGSPLEGPLLFFFRDRFPVTRNQQTATSSDGYFTIINVPPQQGVDVRVIGNLDGTETVLSRHVLPVQGDSLVIADFDPLPEPLQ